MFPIAYDWSKSPQYPFLTTDRWFHWMYYGPTARTYPGYRAMMLTYMWYSCGHMQFQTIWVYKLARPAVLLLFDQDSSKWTDLSKVPK